MQCTNCHFENMPGSKVCGRCGTSMALAESVIDVHPPRAGALAKSLGPLAFWRGIPFWRRPARDAARWLPSPRLDWGIIARMIVPGWPQYYRGRHIRGRFFLAAYLLCLVLGLLYVGTFNGSICLGLAFSVHASASVEVMLDGLVAETRTRLINAVVTTVLLGVLVYCPALWLVTRFASPRLLMAVAPPFRQDDVVLVNQWAFHFVIPRPGHVVLYAIDETRIVADRGYYIGGEHIDRIIAGPGEAVRVKDGHIWINSVESSLRPMNFTLPKELTLSVPPDHYLIFPSGVRGDIPADMWAVVSLVPAGNIRGLVYLRNQPFSRFEIIR